MVVVAGIDVSKATLDVSVSEGPVLRFENSCVGIRSLLKHIDRAGATNAVCESTSGYERLLVSRLNATALTVQVAHPLRVRAFARACGYEAKTWSTTITLAALRQLLWPVGVRCNCRL